MSSFAYYFIFIPLVTWTKGLRSKRRNSPYIFQVVAFLQDGYDPYQRKLVLIILCSLC
jgi:hypothetical protein